MILAFAIFIWATTAATFIWGDLPIWAHAVELAISIGFFALMLGPYLNQNSKSYPRVCKWPSCRCCCKAHCQGRLPAHRREFDPYS